MNIVDVSFEVVIPCENQCTTGTLEALLDRDEVRYQLTYEK